MKPPATIVVGEVVRLREKLDWFERLPLFGKRIVVTRAKGQADAALRAPARAGRRRHRDAHHRDSPAADYAPLDRAIAELDAYDWLIFTSANGVRFFLDRLDRSAVDLRALRAQHLRHRPGHPRGRRSPAPESRPDGQGIRRRGPARSLRVRTIWRASRVLLPRAAVARDLVPAELARRGARVDVVEAYRTVVPGSRGRTHAREIFGGARKPDAIAFTSSSTVRNFVEAAGAASLEGVKAVSIGPVTTETARELGIEVAATARVFTIDGLIEAILDVFRPNA